MSHQGQDYVLNAQKAFFPMYLLAQSLNDCSLMLVQNMWKQCKVGSLSLKLCGCKAWTTVVCGLQLRHLAKRDETPVLNPATCCRLTEQLKEKNSSVHRRQPRVCAQVFVLLQLQLISLIKFLCCLFGVYHSFTAITMAKRIHGNNTFIISTKSLKITFLKKNTYSD